MRYKITVPLLCLFLIGAPTIVLADEPSKPISECAKEYESRKRSLESARVSASAFFHECWWHTRSGRLTVLSRDPPHKSVTASIPDAVPEHSVRPAPRARIATTSMAAPRRAFKIDRHHDGDLLGPTVYALRARRIQRLARMRSARYAESHSALRRKYSLVMRLDTRRRRLAGLSVRSPVRSKTEGVDMSTRQSASIVSSLPPNTRQGREAWIGATDLGTP